MFHGREIQDGHEIHHCDGKSVNNEPDNLAECTSAKHREIHKMARKNKLPVKMATDFVFELDDIEDRIRKKRGKR